MGDCVTTSLDSANVWQATLAAGTQQWNYMKLALHQYNEEAHSDIMSSIHGFSECAKFLCPLNDSWLFYCGQAVGSIMLLFT